jgi:hypothetical protein
MGVLTGTVVEGRVVLKDRALPEGADVYIVARDRDDGPRPGQAELAELAAGIEEADRGETITEEELFERLSCFG